MEAWSYRQITEAAEQQIRASMGLAARHAARANEHRAYAFGAYNLWFRITAGSQMPGDAERLEKLTNGVTP